MRNTTTAAAIRRPQTRILAISILLALAAILALSSAVPAAPPQAPLSQTTVDYDKDDDNLIEISGHAQLNAIRHDLNGDGARGTVSSTNWAVYTTAFPNAVSGMGCPSTCAGYELTDHINLDTNGDGSHTSADAYYNSGAGWTRIGDDIAGNLITGPYTANFNGNGYTIQNLTMSLSSGTADDFGLFGSIHSGRIESLGVTSANVSVTANTFVGILIGTSNNVDIIACYTTGSISGTSNNYGGLVGYASGTTNIRSSYSTASVSGNARIGGLVGNLDGSTITHSYSTGAVSGSNASETGGLVGYIVSTPTITNSYWNTTTSGQTTSVGTGATGRTTTQLQTPTGYTGIYSTWNANLDGVTGNDNPWDFGTASQYPELIYGKPDYDEDDDGLIEISNLAQLHAISLNLNGRGDSTQTAYGAAFPNRITRASNRMGCPSGTCTGYELVADLDFDENGDGQMTATGDPTYWNSGAGWDPLGGSSTLEFTTTFKGNGHTISNLFINRIGPPPIPDTAVNGLFGWVGSSARIESVGVVNANVRGHSFNGVLAGTVNGGEIVACYATGSVTTTNAAGIAGGLVGRLHTSGSITSSHSTARVDNGARPDAGGLVGQLDSSATITNSYSIGEVTGSSVSSGGLVGNRTASAGAVTASYWDTQTSGQATSDGGTAKTTAELKTPTGYTGIYAAWDANIDGVAGNDDPWDFGAAADDHYPVLKYAGFEAFPQGRGDFDLNNDGLIEIKTLAQLNAVRHDMNGNGDSTDPAYIAAFPGRESGAANRMGCPAGACTGYELLANLDFDSDGDGDVDENDHGGAYWDSGAGWQPLGMDTAPTPAHTEWTATFRGNGYTVDNLYISRSNTTSIGLFRSIGNNGRIESLGVTNADVRGANFTGILAAFSSEDIVACYTTGSVSGSANTGGLLGYQSTASSLTHSSYSTATVSGGAQTGGLIGEAANGAVTNSYAIGRVTATATHHGGLVGRAGPAATVTASYWNSQTSGQAGSGTGKTTAELQSPTAYGATSSDTYFGWNANIDGVTGADDPWNFCTGRQYPALKYGGHDPLRQGSCGDYDLDDDGYIDVFTLAQLDAMRHDLNGNGDATAAGYIAAFPNRITAAATRMGCPSGACTGYELVANLDFDTNGNGIVGTGDTADAYYNGGNGWNPIGRTTGGMWETNFKGNGHTINNLFINRTTTTTDDNIGLFGNVASGATFESVGVINANVTGRSAVGILVGQNRGSITACYTTGVVAGGGSGSGANARIGGLTGSTSGSSSASIRSSYSTAAVTASANAGGLTGRFTDGSITNSYSTGRVTASSNAGGLIGVGSINFPGTVSNSYWDTVSSGRSTSNGGTGKTPRELQTVTGYSGIYADWNANLDGESGNDDPWDFGNGMQYPMLDYKGMSTAPQGGQAMGIADNWNAPVAGERLGVCLTPEEYPNRGIVSGQTYHEAWVWEWSANGGTGWTVISGAGDGDNPPTYEYSPTATDVGRYLRAKVKLTDGSFAITRTLGGPVVGTDAAITASGATAGDEIAFINGHAAPQVGRLVVATNVLLPGDRDVRSGWQRCPNNTAPHSDCTSIPLRWQVSYTPVAADVGNYLRYYMYYQTDSGTWTRRVTPFTTGVVAAASP